MSLKNWQVDVIDQNDQPVAQGLRTTTFNLVEHFVDRLNIHRFHNHIKIKFYDSDVLCDDSYACGYCTRWGKRQFMIELALYNNWCTFLAHEMVHVKQNLRDQITPQLNSWEGIPVLLDTPYYETPWEMEAYALQWGLVQDFYTLKPGETLK